PERPGERDEVAGPAQHQERRRPGVGELEVEQVGVPRRIGPGAGGGDDVFREIDDGHGVLLGLEGEGVSEAKLAGRVLDETKVAGPGYWRERPHFVVNRRLCPVALDQNSVAAAVNKS